MKKFQFVLMLIGIFVGNAYSATTPEFFGYYANNNNKLIELDSNTAAPYEFSPNVQFFVFQPHASDLSSQLHVTRMFYIRTIFNPGLDGKQPPKNENKWNPRKDGGIEMRVKPVAGHEDQAYVVPKTPLQPGRYQISFGTSGSNYKYLGEFLINKDMVTANFQKGGDCIDIFVRGGWSSMEYDLNGAGARAEPCSDTSPTSPGSYATKELLKFADRQSMSIEDEKKWRAVEENRKKTLPFSPELIQLKSDQNGALLVNNTSNLIALSLKVLRIDPNDYESLDYLSNLLTKVGNPDESLMYAVEIFKRGFITGRIFAEITFAYLAKKDIDNTLLWLEKTLQSKFPYAPTEKMMNEAFPEHQARISQLFEKYRAEKK